MGELNRFLKKNKKVKPNIKVPATVSLQDEDGKPLLWEIRAITTKEDNRLRDDCMIDVPVKGKAGQFRPKLDTSKYLGRLAATCVVYPNLNDKELQDSYGVMSGESLIYEMIDNPGEFNDFLNIIQEHNGFVDTLEDKVDEAKN